MRVTIEINRVHNSMNVNLVSYVMMVNCHLPINSLVEFHYFSHCRRSFT